MTRFLLFPLAGIMFMLTSCETVSDEIQCTPERLTLKVSEGTSASEYISEYKYENERLDRVVMSNFQTHYYFYNDSGRLDRISRMDVKAFQKRESRYIYEGDRVVRTDEYLMNLDRFTQTDIDTTYTGYRAFVYEGEFPVEEHIYLAEGGSSGVVLAETREFARDVEGNITRLMSLRIPAGDTLEYWSYSYDNMNHPLVHMDMPFEGESHVNNINHKEDLLTGDTYTYRIVYNSTRFPENISIRINDLYFTEIFDISYTCRQVSVDKQ